MQLGTPDIRQIMYSMYQPKTNAVNGQYRTGQLIRDFIISRNLCGVITAYGCV